MKLIGSLTSPYVRKVRIVMAEKKLDYQFVVEDVWASDAITRINPLGKVPCLVMDGQDTIAGAVFDSAACVSNCPDTVLRNLVQRPRSCSYRSLVVCHARFKLSPCGLFRETCGDFTRR